MNTSLEHLPKEKQELIRYIVSVIVERIQPEKVILYGSYATNKWVEDEYYEDNILYDYKSDYDFLIITKSGEKRSDYEVQEIIEHRSGLNTNVSAITHDIDYINGKLAEGQYFFSDIQKEGILLYDASGVALGERKELSREEKRKLAQNDFDNWYNSSKTFLQGSKYYLSIGAINIATFELHQSLERAYNTIILVFRGYKPKTHNIEKLHRYSKHFSKKIEAIFPRNTDEEKHLFELIKKGYVEARYDKNYKITEEELKILITRVERIQQLAEEICKKRIESF